MNNLLAQPSLQGHGVHSLEGLIRRHFRSQLLRQRQASSAQAVEEAVLLLLLSIWTSPPRWPAPSWRPSTHARHRDEQTASLGLAPHPPASRASGSAHHDDDYYLCDLVCVCHGRDCVSVSASGSWIYAGQRGPCCCRADIVCVGAHHQHAAHCQHQGHARRASDPVSAIGFGAEMWSPPLHRPWHHDRGAAAHHLAGVSLAAAPVSCPLLLRSAVADTHHDTGLRRVRSHSHTHHASVVQLRPAITPNTRKPACGIQDTRKQARTLPASSTKTTC